MLCLDLWDNLRTPNAKVASLLWFARFGTRIDEGTQMLSCSHLVDHTYILLISQVNLIGQRSFLENKTSHFFVHCFLQLL